MIPMAIVNQDIIERLCHELKYESVVQKRAIEFFDKTRTLLSRNSVMARALASVHLAAREAGVASSMTESFGRYRAGANLRHRRFFHGYFFHRE
ncbi:MAG: cyclin family protein [Candidatus Nitrosopolaris sp.]